MYHLDRIIPFNAIVAIDDDGDQYAKFPHLYIGDINNNNNGIYISGGNDYDSRHFKCDPEKEIGFFSKLVVEKEANQLKPEPPADA